MLGPVVIALAVFIATPYQRNHLVTGRDVREVIPPDPEFVAVTRGAEHSCGLTAAGRVFCWGSNRLGQLGNESRSGRLARSDRPTAVATTERFKAISAGGEHTCGLTRAGAVYCWGLNLTAELGQFVVADACDGGPADSQATTPGPLFACSRRPLRLETNTRFESISAGFGHTCALSGGRAFCWGRNDHGQLGTSHVGDSCDGLACSILPVQVTGAPPFSSISAGGSHTCGLADGVAYCWGSNQYGQLGRSVKDRDFSRPTPVAIEERVVAIDAGGIHTCVTTNAGRQRCWGTALPSPP